MYIPFMLIFVGLFRSYHSRLSLPFHIDIVSLDAFSSSLT